MTSDHEDRSLGCNSSLTSILCKAIDTYHKDHQNLTLREIFESFEEIKTVLLETFVRKS